MRISGYHHLSLSVTDIDKSVEWYSTVLGFTKATQFDGDGFVRARLFHGEMPLALTCHHDRSDDKFSERRTGMDHVGFQVPTVEEVGAYKRHFEALGVDHSEIKPAGSGAGAMITLRDPDNIQVEVTCPGS